jgi:hypothetical protein
MKKWISLLICAVMLFALFGCGKKEPQEPVEPSHDDEGDYYEIDETTPEPTPEPVYVKIGTVHNVDTYLNIRSGPGTAYDVLGKARSGDRFLILTEYYSENWHQVEYDGGIAYIHADYLQITEEPLTDETDNPSGDDESSDYYDAGSYTEDDSGDI